MSSALDGYRRMTLLGAARQIVDCPRCPARRGEYCISSGGHQNSLVKHAPRAKALAALGLSEDEQYAEMVAISDARDAARRAGQAQIDARTNTPEIRESQARTGEAWRQVAAEVGAQFRLRPVLQDERDNRPPLGPIRGVTDIAEHRARKAARSTTPQDIA